MLVIVIILGAINIVTGILRFGGHIRFLNHKRSCSNRIVNKIWLQINEHTNGWMK